MRRKLVRAGVALLPALVIAGCAAGVNTAAGPAADGDVAGFWLGLWQGIIAPITFIISLFDDDVNIYEVHNSGNWYDFGFMLGVGISIGGLGRTPPSGSSGRKKD
jgi:hypothetical protein